MVMSWSSLFPLSCACTVAEVISRPTSATAPTVNTAPAQLVPSCRVFTCCLLPGGCRGCSSLRRIVSHFALGWQWRQPEKSCIHLYFSVGTKILHRRVLLLSNRDVELRANADGGKHGARSTQIRGF